DRYDSCSDAMNELMSDNVPVRVRADGVPPIITPLPLDADRLPAGTDNVAVIGPVPASMSAKLMPVMVLGLSLTTDKSAGKVIVGASFTAFTLRSTVIM